MNNNGEQQQQQRKFPKKNKKFQCHKITTTEWKNEKPCPCFPFPFFFKSLILWGKFIGTCVYVFFFCFSLF